MKYTKAFEKYWIGTKQDIDVGTHWSKLKKIAFLAWKAAIKHYKETEKKTFDHLISELRNEREERRKIIQEMREKNE